MKIGLFRLMSREEPCSLVWKNSFCTGGGGDSQVRAESAELQTPFGVFRDSVYYDWPPFSKFCVRLLELVALD